MEYKFEHQNYNNFDVFEDNKLPSRAYFIPHTSKTATDETTYLDERYKSKKIVMLSGEWDFSYFQNIYQVPKGKNDLDKWKFDKVMVPSVWQMTGYEEPCYVNQRYEFPLDPPNIPGEMPIEHPNKVMADNPNDIIINNSIGIYRKKFNVTNADKHRILTFLGVCSCVEVYVNGEYVGYSEGSHNTAEFDITKKIKKGENEIVALVYKWCNGTYLECQDMFRHNGIFRDVYIIETDETYVWDYAIETDKIDDSNKYHLSIDANIKGDIAGVTVRYSLYRDGECRYTYEIEPKGNVKDSHAKIDYTLDADEWSAENPNLYILYVELIRNSRTFECIRQEIGFKSVKIEGNVFKFNGAPIKMLGVNHHDTTEHAGFTMTIDELKRDVELMKEYNVNTVRTSHYPPDPVFLKLANYYGLYIVDEADIETHGTYGMWKYWILCNEHLISQNLAWKEHYWDRVHRMFERDKNNVAVTMWSLGNEAGGYRCQDYCYSKLKPLASVPIHYEAVCRTKRWAYDVLSHMYFPTEKYENYINGKLPKKYYTKPFFECEYAHAMGVGPGSLEYYVDLFYKSEGLMGGCIWEWADHAIKHDAKDKYKYEYTYGGDHGEWEHDVNFCVDGLFYPDRRPSIGAYMMKQAYRPVKVARVGTNEYEIFNRYAFTSLSVLDIEWQLLENGEIVDSGTIKEDIKPGESKVVKIAHKDVQDDKDTFIIFRHVRDGKVIAFEEIELNKFVQIEENNSKTVMGMNIIDTEDMVGIKYTDGAIIFNKIDGALQSYSLKGVEYISQQPSNRRRQKGILPSIYRAPVDNYRNIRHSWEKMGLDKASYKMSNISSPIVQGNHYVITIDFDVLGLNKREMKFSYLFKIHQDGIVDVDVNVANNGKKIDIPKIGSVLEMPKEFCNTRFYGLGDIENYSDCKEHTLMGIYSKKVGEFEDKYIKPQDSGNMSEVRWSEVTNDNGDGIRFIAKYKPFNFKATRVEDEVLMKANHIEDVYESQNTIVHISGFMRGIGSNSCGPDTRSEFRLYLDKSYSYSFRMMPIRK